MTDDEPKSAIELAMERLRRQDAEQGLVEQPLTDDQKQRIEEARRACRAKLAQFEIMHRSKLSGTYDPEERATLEGSIAGMSSAPTKKGTVPSKRSGAKRRHES